MSKSIIGVVSSDTADKTIVITVRLHKTHPLYKKAYSVTKRFMAHDEKNEAVVGDTVSIVETRPISRNKHFKLEKIVEKAAISADKTVDAITAEPVAEKPVKAEKSEKTTKPAAKKKSTEEEA